MSLYYKICTKGKKGQKSSHIDMFLQNSKALKRQNGIKINIWGHFLQKWKGNSNIAVPKKREFLLSSAG